MAVIVCVPLIGSVALSAKLKKRFLTPQTPFGMTKTNVFPLREKPGPLMGSNGLTLNGELQETPETE
jgi:hypothetical protein